MNASLEVLDGETMEDFLNNVPDILISAYLIVGIFVALALFVFAFLIFRAVLGVIKSVGRVVNNVERASDVAVDRIVTPLEEGLSFAAAAGNALCTAGWLAILLNSEMAPPVLAIIPVPEVEVVVNSF